MTDTAKVMFAYMVEEKNGTEGVIAIILDGQPFPLVSSNPKMVDLARPAAIAHAKSSGRPVNLVRFDKSTVLDTLDGTELEKYGDR